MVRSGWQRTLVFAAIHFVVSTLFIQVKQSSVVLAVAQGTGAVLTATLKSTGGDLDGGHVMLIVQHGCLYLYFEGCYRNLL